MKLKYFIVALFLAFSGGIFAQEDLELAEYYFNNGEFEQAKLYYEKIYKKNRTNKVYENYLKTLIALDDFDGAEDLAKKKLKSTNDKAIGHVDLGSLYATFGMTDDANDNYDKAIKELQPGRSNGVRLGNKFIKLNEFDYALADL